MLTAVVCSGRNYEEKLNSLSGLAVATGACVPLTAFVVAAVWFLARLRKRRSNRLFNTLASVMYGMYLIVLIPAVLLLCVFLLTWIGIAAGIH